MEDSGLIGVLVLIYIDDVLIVGRGKGRVCEQAARAVHVLRAAGGIISPKSTLEPVTRLVWLGKDVDLSGGSLSYTYQAFLGWQKLPRSDPGTPAEGETTGCGDAKHAA